MSVKCRSEQSSPQSSGGLTAIHCTSPRSAHQFCGDGLFIPGTRIRPRERENTSSLNVCQQGTSPYLVPVQYFPAPGFVPVYSRPSRSLVDRVIEADTPEVVRLTTPQYHYSHPPPPPYYPYYLPSPAPVKSDASDDLHYRMRPNLDSVVSRDYSQYGPLSWSWADFTRHNRNSKRNQQTWGATF